MQGSVSECSTVRGKMCTNCMVDTWRIRCYNPELPTRTEFEVAGVTARVKHWTTQRTDTHRNGGTWHWACHRSAYSTAYNAVHRTFDRKTARRCSGCYWTPINTALVRAWLLSVCWTVSPSCSAFILFFRHILCRKFLGLKVLEVYKSTSHIPLINISVFFY